MVAWSDSRFDESHVQPSSGGPGAAASSRSVYHEVYLRSRYQALELTVAELQRRMLEGQIRESEFEHRRNALLTSLRRLWREGERLVGTGGSQSDNPVSEALFLHDGLRLMEFMRLRGKAEQAAPDGSYPPLDLPPD